MRLIVTILSILGLVCPSLAQDKPVSVETIERVKYAVVPIVCGRVETDGALKITKIMGSGFFINEDGYFLTAGHVLTNWETIDKSQGDCRPYVYVAIGGWRNDRKGGNVRYFPFSACTYNNQADIAACRPTSNPFLDEVVKAQIKSLKFAPFIGSKDGTPVAFTAFPLDSLRPVTSKGNIASYVEVDNKFMIDKSTWPGASGSPVYVYDGTVIGVVIQLGIGVGTGLAYARPSETVMDFLRTNKINFHQEQKKTK
jgi:S1-C subfamily serine protease